MKLAKHSKVPQRPKLYFPPLCLFHPDIYMLQHDFMSTFLLDELNTFYVDFESNFPITFSDPDSFDGLRFAYKHVRMLFINYSLVFNTIAPSKCIMKLRDMGPGYKINFLVYWPNV